MICDLLLTPAVTSSHHHRHGDRHHRRSSVKLATATRHLAVVVTLLVITFASPARGEFPPDLQPLSLFSSQESGRYSVFVGSDAADPEETHLLYDLSGVKKINSTFYLHARNYIFVLDYPKSVIGEKTGKVFHHKQAIFWNVTSVQNSSCHRVLGRTVRQCQNFVTMLEQMRSDTTNKASGKLIACGNHGYSPTTKVFAMEKDGKLRDVSGERNSRVYSYYCSAVPFVKTPSFSNAGHVYVGIERKYGETFIARMDDKRPLKALRTSQDETKHGSDFVRIVEGSEESGKIFVFFNEFAKEDLDKRKLARVGQICKNDKVLTDLRYFTSFFKTRLNCSLAGFPPYYFDLVHATSDVVTIRSATSGGRERVVFAVMRTPSNGILTSAICVYSLAEVEDSLASASMASYKDVWVKSDESAKYPDISSCGHIMDGKRSLNKSQIDFALGNSLVSKVVQTWNVFSLDLKPDPKIKPATGPIFTSKNDVLTTILVDDEVPPNTSSTSDDNLTYVTMLIGTDIGDVIKVLLLTSLNRSVVVERRQVYNDELCGDGDKSVRSLELDKEHGNLLVSYSSCAVMVPLCHPSPAALHCETDCKKLRDPYCQWNGSTCVSTFPKDVTRDQDLTGEERLPECDDGVVVVPVAPITKTTIPTDKAGNGTEGGSKQVNIRQAGGGDGSTLYILVAFIGFFVGIIITSFIFCCCNPCHEIKKKRHHLINGEAGKSAVSRTNSHRLDSASSATGNILQPRVKHPSESSTKSHMINNRISYYDDVIVDGVTSAQRRRHVTEASGGGASSGEGRSRNNSTAKTPTEGGNVRDFESADDKRKSRKLSTTSKSSTTARNLQNVNKLSTSSNPQQHRDDVGTLNKNMMLSPTGTDMMGGDVFARQISSESGHGSDHHRSTLPQQPPGNGQHGELRRSYSVQQPNGHSIHRTASFGPGIPPKGRGIARQHSFQVTSHPHNPHDLHFTATTPMMMMPSQQPGNPRDKWMPKTPMAPPPSMMVPISQSAKGMTYSLDRRKMKAFPPAQNPDFQISKLANSPQKQHGDPQQQHPQRQRYVSESMTPMHPAVHQKHGVNMLDYAIIEDPSNPPQTPQNPYPTGNRSRRDQLRLDLRGAPVGDPASSMGTRRRIMVQQQPSPAGTPVHVMGGQQAAFRKPSLPPQQLPSPMERRSFNFPTPSHRQRTPAGTPMDEDLPLLGEEAPVRKLSMKELRTPSNPDINGAMRHDSDSMTPSIPESPDRDSLNSIDDETEYMETVA